MAQSRRVAIDPSEAYALHAEEVQTHLAAAREERHDEAITHYDYAHAYHSTAARIMSNASKQRGAVTAYRQAAAAARARRRLDVAEQYDKLAADAEAAIAYAPIQAARFQAMGMERLASGHATLAAAQEAAQADEAATAAAIAAPPVSTPSAVAAAEEPRYEGTTTSSGSVTY